MSITGCQNIITFHPLVILQAIKNSLHKVRTSRKRRINEYPGKKTAPVAEISSDCRNE
jgi:hypothetical protein